MKEKSAIITVILFLGGTTLLGSVFLEYNPLKAMIGITGSPEEKETILTTEEVPEISIKTPPETKTIEESKEETVDEVKTKEDEEITKIDINSANEEKLQEITGIGPTYAKRITEKRPFCALTDIKKISGIGEKTLKNIKSQGLAIIDSPKNCKNPLPEKEIIENKEEIFEKLEEIEKRIEGLKEKITEKEKIKEVEINSASKEDLEKITGIGPAYAKRIMEKRPFCTLSDIKEISGIGEKTLKNIKSQGLTTVEIPDTCFEEEKSSDKGKEDKEITEVEINSASKEDLQEITGIGPTYAKKIIEKRPFCNLSELKDISGIGEKTLKNIKSQGLAIVESPESCGKSKEERPTSTSSSTSKTKEKITEVEINSASKENLEKITGIGPAYAKRIIEKRPFCTLSELKGISGIGKKRLKNIKSQGLATIDPPKSCLDTGKIEISPDELNFKLKNTTKEIKIENNRKEQIRFNFEINYLKEESDWLNIETKKKTVATESVTDLFVSPVSEKIEEEKEYLAEIKVKFLEKEKVIPTSLLIKTPENLLQNEFFKLWKNDIPLSWDKGPETHLSDISKPTPTTKSFLKINHSYVGERDVEQKVTHEKASGRKTTYYGKIYVKGTGYIRTGIQRPGYNYRHSEWEKLEEKDWVSINTKAKKDKREESDLGFRIQTTSRDPDDKEGHKFDETSLYINSAWLSTEKPPQNWP